QEDAEMLILQARVAAGWIDASELPQPEYVEEETLEGDVEFDGEGQEDAQADEADADADAEVVADDLDDQSRDMDRQDLASRQVLDESRLIRFVGGPDGAVAPDLGRKLPGRGLWVAADRASLEAAIKKNLFARAAKAPLKPAADLPDLVESLLVRRCLDQLGLARREGVLISGFEKCAAAIRSGRAAWLIEAADGSADGRGKLLALSRHASPAPEICGAFSADDLSLALGLEN
ncbi:hypothetical protein LTR94_029662, partial [Friedmanniomyces endolithicus]